MRLPMAYMGAIFTSFYLGTRGGGGLCLAYHDLLVVMVLLSTGRQACQQKRNQHPLQRVQGGRSNIQITIPAERRSGPVMSRSESWILGELLNHPDDLRDDYHDLFGNIAVLVDPGACHCRFHMSLERAPICAVAPLLFSRVA